MSRHSAEFLKIGHHLDRITFFKNLSYQKMTTFFFSKICRLSGFELGITVIFKTVYFLKFAHFLSAKRQNIAPLIVYIFPSCPVRNEWLSTWSSFSTWEKYEWMCSMKPSSVRFLIIFTKSSDTNLT